MTHRSSCRWLRSVVAAASLLAIAFSGCGESGPELVPVSGKVLIDDKPLTYGQVRFIPEVGRPAVGQLDAQGKFELVTDDAKGCAKGKHAVEVHAIESIGEYENKVHAPPMYSVAATSGITEEISGPRDDIELKLYSRIP